MFERLVQKVLGNFLSKYFTEESLNRNKINRSTQLGVWSGYISLQDLELKKDYINGKLRSKGQAFEISHCSIRQIEITIPWAKLSNPLGSPLNENDAEAVVVIVIDGIHILAHTNFDFDDVALRKEEVKRRRKALSNASRLGASADETESYSDIIKKRLKEGFFQEIANRLHIHIRDLHIRLEDVQSDPCSPCACGVTLESMHIQHDENAELEDGIVTKLASLNHLAFYWNAIEPQENLPAEHSILHKAYLGDPEKLAFLMNSCIARRASLIASPSRKAYIPTHTYLLLPVDGTLTVRLSTDPKDLSQKPAIEAALCIDPVAAQLRDFQMAHILRLANEYKNHRFVRKYRKFRPLVSAKEAPSAWWKYAARVIRYQLRETFLRWSKTRFFDVFATRRVYMDLYQRKLLFGNSVNSPGLDDESIVIPISKTNESFEQSRADLGSKGAEGKPLTEDEEMQLQQIEDGLLGEMSTSTILFLRAIINSRLGSRTATVRKQHSQSLWRSTTLASVVQEDSEAQDELEKLLEYIEKSSDDASFFADDTQAHMQAISFRICFERLSLALLAPLATTIEESPTRQIHEKFLEISLIDLRAGFMLMGDFATKEFHLSIGDVCGTESRSDKSIHVLAKKVNTGMDTSFDSSEHHQSPPTNPLVAASLRHGPGEKRAQDLHLTMFVGHVEFEFTPECEWLPKVKAMKKTSARLIKVSDFWDALTLANFNTSSSGKFGIVAKVESATNEHKNLHADIKIRCPTIRLADSLGNHMIVDLGVAHFKTEKLAGVANNDARTFAERIDDDDISQEASLDHAAKRVDDASVLVSLSGKTWASKPRIETPTGERRRGERRFHFSSVTSIDSRNQSAFANRSFNGSLLFDEQLPRQHPNSKQRAHAANSWNHLFYDVFSLQLTDGRVTLCSESELTDLLPRFEIETIFKKSIVPADHTLCKVKVQTMVKNLTIHLKESVIATSLNMVDDWKNVFNPTNTSLETSDMLLSTPRHQRRLDDFSASRGSEAYEEESLSQIDENDFFDTNEGSDSYTGDGSAIWFEDNWISDAESFFDGDSRSFQNDRHSRRRRAGSISDVSSASDQSTTKDSPRDTPQNRKAQQVNAYLSAENLARLEEGAGEDESIGPSAIEHDDDSFHSVMSFSEQQQVLQELENDIDRVKNDIHEKAKRLRDENKDVIGSTSANREKLLKRRRSLKLELRRTKTELHGLLAVRDELKQLLAQEPLLQGADTATISSRRTSAINNHARSTRMLLSARQQRDASEPHNMVKELNRELFQGSLVIENIVVCLELSQSSNGPQTRTENEDGLIEIVASQVGLAFFKHIYDTKFYFSCEQLNATSRSKTEKASMAQIIFSGGSTDTLLPSHFPHLVSRSMEERFLRGSIHIGKRRALDGANGHTKSKKVRIVVGDIEILPSPDALGMLQHFKMSAGRRTDTSRPVKTLSTSTSGENGIGRGPATMQLSEFADFAVRMTSIRVVLGASKRIIGAAVATEAAIRLVNVVSSKRDKMQLDFRCTNFQALEISSLEAGRGSEIFGRRDPYNALVQARVRSEIVPESQRGGWVVGNDFKSHDESRIDATSLSRNAHVHVRINHFVVICLPQSIVEFSASLAELKRQINPPPTDIGHKTDGSNTTRGRSITRFLTGPRLRWRVDVSSKRIILKLADSREEGLYLEEDINSKLLLALSITCCLQQSRSRLGCFSSRLVVSEVAFLRSPDDWPILEPFSFLCESESELPMTLLPHKKNPSHEPLSLLELKSTSQLGEIEAVVERYGWDTTSTVLPEGCDIGIAVQMTPLKVNLSSNVIGVIVDFALSMKQIANNKNPSPESNITTGAPETAKRIGCHLVFEEVEIQMLKETEMKPIANAKALLSFNMSDVRLDYERGGQIAATILIRNSSIFDYSSPSGLRVLGENSADEGERSPFFVQVKIFMDTNLDAPTTLRLDISWGRIQCLLLPSFLQSVLDLKDQMQAAFRAQPSLPETKAKENMLEKFLGLKKDLNISLSAHTDSFECILASRDLVEYVRQSENDPIGAVTFRWKASLMLSLALDNLTGVSVPWLTLDLDGRFTDSDDTSLFKDFVNRYLSSSSGLLAGSDEIGQQLLNVFTVRIGLSLSNFEVIRTNITSHFVKPNSRRMSYKSAHRLCFMVDPPKVGEQRVSNPIDVDIVHRITGASMMDMTNDKPHPHIEISQLLQVRAKFVDILIYISQSSGGFTEAYRASIKPAIEIFKRKKKKDARRKVGESDNTALQVESDVPEISRPSWTSLFKSASSLCTIQLEGFQVTCVPGGATRLNESPILKVELNKFVSGLVATPIPVSSKLGSDRTLRSTTSSQNLLAAVDVAHLTLAGWVACEISGHYHNRRLVAWEPFLEPWIADLRIGLDMVDVGRCLPTIRFSRGELRSPSNSSTTSEKKRNTEATADRLRDFGKLFRAPFQHATSMKENSNGRLLISHADFCYLMLTSTSRSTLLSVLYPTTESAQDKEARLFSRLPAREKVDWLRSFGFPSRDVDDSQSLQLLIGDSRPLNVNLTGALIENVLSYIQGAKSSGLNSIAPHCIRNDTGMIIRFQEVLDGDRLKRGEELDKNVVLNGCEVPLTLKRSLSQTCDPHRAYILLELGSFEETLERLKIDEVDIPKGSLSSSFFFKASAKIPVDTVGVHRYPLDRNYEARSDSNISSKNSRSLGWIIVRVGLRDGIKIVSIESPLTLKSTADSDLVCEVRDFNRFSLLWRCVVPKYDGRVDDGQRDDGLIPVPADIVPFLHDKSHSFSIIAVEKYSSYSTGDEELPGLGGLRGVSVTPPAPFSPQSYGRGLLGEENISLSTFDPSSGIASVESVHITVTSLRIGTFSGVGAAVQVPEQRMMIFRAPVSVRNCLALPIAVQVRLKGSATSDNFAVHSSPRGDKSGKEGWEDLGLLDCGQSVNWTGARATDKVQMRIRFVGTDGDNSRRFPGWSSPVFVPPRTSSRRESNKQIDKFSPFAKMRLLDAENTALDLSVAFDRDSGLLSEEPTIQENIRLFADALASGSRAISIFVPYWIVDSSNQDLEFSSGTAVAGQLDGLSEYESKSGFVSEEGSTLGLAELLDNDNFLRLPATRSFDVMMVGDESSTRLTVRKRLGRRSRKVFKRLATPWSDPIPLQSTDSSQHDITVLSPRISQDEKVLDPDEIRGFDLYVLRSNVLPAPGRFGGMHGTKLIHIINRYSILNETGRDVEISSDRSDTVVLIRSTGIPQPFHFDDTRPMRFRFREFGWTWSGKFCVRSSRPEVTMRVRHKMKAQVVIVTIELIGKKKGSTNVLVFRESNHPPFRLENHTMFPLHFGQALTRRGSDELEADTMLLPYQNMAFAWDEPEFRRKTLIIKSTDVPNLSEGSVLGRFQLETIAPGTHLILQSIQFLGDIVADGPTRVLRITDASMPSLAASRDENTDFRRRPNEAAKISFSITLRLNQGIGISIVDWSPQELLYIRLEDIQVEKQTNSQFDAVSLAIGNIKLNNQLWVTPYPVLLKMGRSFDSSQATRRRNRRHDAISVTLRRTIDRDAGYGNLTLFERVDIAFEPVFVNVDGQVVSLLFKMMNEIFEMRSGASRRSTWAPRDDQLRELLNLVVRTAEINSVTPQDQTPYQQGSDGDLMATAAVAAKLRAQPLPFVKISSKTLRNNRSISQRKNMSQSVAKPQRKFYIERLRISATKADVSWSGPIPGLVSSLLLRAFTFERLPLRLRPYSILHSYGSARDHLQSLKSHYVSIWRALDLFMGLSYNPTFLFRAILYTSRETCASILDNWAAEGRRVAKELNASFSTDTDLQPVYDDGTLPYEIPRSFDVGKAAISPLARATSSLFSVASEFSSIVATLLRYRSQGSQRLAAGGLRRSRNPRLFAHMDGRDLLVEYVEGENAGKALLSRVRMGVHLGEGYVFHFEGVRRPAKNRKDFEQSPYILMITTERVLLLNGKLDWNFCTVVWEAMFMNIVDIELIPANDLLLGNSLDEVIIWYLSDTTFSEGNSSTKYSGVDLEGVDVLESMSIHVPKDAGFQIMERLASIDDRLAHTVDQYRDDAEKLKKD